MENKLEKWFEASRNVDPEVSLGDMESMVFKPGDPKREKPNSVSTRYRTIIVSGFAIICLSSLVWYQNSFQLNEPANLPKAEKIFEEQPALILQEKTSEEKVKVSAQEQQNKDNANLSIKEESVNSDERFQYSSSPAQKQIAEEREFTEGGPVELSYAELRPFGISFNGKVSATMSKEGNNSYLRLAKPELEKLGIVFVDHGITYINKLDTPVTFESGCGPDFATKKTVAYAFNFKVDNTGGMRSNNIHDDNVELKERSNPVKPLLVSLEDKHTNPQYRASSLLYLLGDIRVMPEFQDTFIREMKRVLIPVAVKTQPSDTGGYNRETELVFWFRNNEVLRNALPEKVSVVLRNAYPEFDAHRYEEFVAGLRTEVKKEELRLMVDENEKARLRSTWIHPSAAQLKKLGIENTGKVIRYEVETKNPAGEFVGIEFDANPARVSMTQYDKGDKPLPLKNNDCFPWYVTDTAMKVVYNFVGESKKHPDLVNKSEFMKARGNLVPVYIALDRKEVKRCKEKHCENSFLFWFPRKDACIDIETRHQKDSDHGKVSQEKIDMKGLQIIDPGELFLEKQDITKGEGTVTLKMKPFMLVEISVKGSVNSYTGLSREHYDQLPEDERGDSVIIDINGQPQSQIKLYLKKDTDVHPEPLLITDVKGLNWYMQVSDEVVDSKYRDYISLARSQLHVDHQLNGMERKDYSREAMLSIIGSLIPVRIYSKSMENNPYPFGIIMWYKPSEELFALLPSGNEIKAEYEAISRNQSSPTCKYFESCRNVKGKINGYTIFPNPLNDVLHVEVDLAEERKLDMTLTDITGRIIKELTRAEHQEKGKKEYSFTVGEIKEGVYLLNIETEKGERISQRLIRKQ